MPSIDTACIRHGLWSRQKPSEAFASCGEGGSATGTTQCIFHQVRAVRWHGSWRCCWCHGVMHLHRRAPMLRINLIKFPFFNFTCGWRWLWPYTSVFCMAFRSVFFKPRAAQEVCGIGMAESQLLVFLSPTDPRRHCSIYFFVNVRVLY